MKKALYYFGLICIAIFLFTIHAKYLYRLIPSNETDLFVFWNINFKIYLPYVWGAAFGVVTAIILSLLDRVDPKFWLFVFSVAFLEFIGVWLYNQTELKDNWFWTMSSIYYGVYAGFIIVIYAYIKVDAKDSQKNAKKDSREIRANAKNENDDKVMQMIKSGIDLKLISEDLNINLSTVYRIKKKYENGH